MPSSRLFLIILMWVFLPAHGLTQTSADKITGIWKTQDGDAHIQIYKGGDGKFYGKIHWLELPFDSEGKPRTDIENPDPSRKKDPLMGLVLMKNFTYDPKTAEWSSGTVYDSKSGNTYSGYMKIEPNGDLYLKGYVMGMRWLGRSNVWTRVR